MAVNLVKSERPALTGEDIRELSFILGVRLQEFRRWREIDVKNGEPEDPYWREQRIKTERIKAKLDKLYAEDGLYAPPF